MHQEIKRRLEIPEWAMGWDGYAIAATILKIMSFKEATAHKLTVLEVAALGVAEGRGSLLGVLYDEVVRCVFAGFVWAGIVFC